MSAAPLENCFNCGQPIGRLETPHRWDEKIVCEPCHVKLSNGFRSDLDVESSSPSAQPLPSSANRPPPAVDVQTIELAGKKFKARTRAGLVVAFIGVFIILAGALLEIDAISILGILLFVIGIGIYSVAQISAWWHRG